MRRLLPAITIAAAALVAACTASAAPNWTYAPPTAPPASQPAASGGASAAPSAAPSGGASAAPDLTPVPGGPSGTAVQISALNIAFEQTAVSAPAGAAFDIHFNNKDAGTPHNIEIKDPNNQSVFKGDIVTGPIETDYHVPALAAGAYTFACSVHPNMQGSLKVGG